MRDYVHPGTSVLGETGPHTMRIALHQFSAEFVLSTRRFRRSVGSSSDDFDVNCTGEIFVRQMARRKCAVRIAITASSKRTHLHRLVEHNSRSRVLANFR